MKSVSRFLRLTDNRVINLEQIRYAHLVGNVWKIVFDGDVSTLSVSDAEWKRVEAHLDLADRER